MTFEAGDEEKPIEVGLVWGEVDGVFHGYAVSDGEPVSLRSACEENIGWPISILTFDKPLIQVPEPRCGHCLRIHIYFTECV